MNTVCVSVIYYVLEFVKLYIVIHTFLGIRQRKGVVPVLALSTLVVMLVALFFNITKYPMIFGLVACGILILNAYEKRRAGLIALFYMGISVIDMFFAVIIRVIFGTNIGKINHLTWLKIGINSILFVLIWGVSRLLQKRKIQYEIVQEKKYLPAYIMTGIAMLLYLCSVQFLDEHVMGRSVFYMFVFSLTAMVLVVVCDLLMINRSKNTQLMQEAESQARLLEMQKAYYTMLLMKENETKAFRHDIKNHIYWMRNLCQENQYNELQLYLEEMHEEVDKLLPKVDTGNSMITALVNHISAKYPQIDLQWKGMMPEKLRISSVDLCTILSNLLTNAFEAASKCESPNVEVQVKFLESNMMLVVTNSLAISPKMKDGEFVSDKAEEGHGYGIRNVKFCVEKYKGRYSALVEDDVFITKVILPASR